MRIPVVLDVDTGVDDACAILLAALHPSLELRAVTCVSGNCGVDSVVANTLTVLDAADRPDVVVARGAAQPLLETPVAPRLEHGRDGMGDLDWPRSRRPPDPRHAVEVLRDVLGEAVAGEATGRVTLVSLGPLTNIALLLRTYPGVAKGLRELVFVGGALRPDGAQSGEFNIARDPEAAAAVLDACADLGVRVTMYGLDVFPLPRVPRTVADRLVAAGGRGAPELAGALIGFQCSRHGTATASIGDAGGVCAVIEPGGVRTEVLPVRVELAGAWSRGRTVLDPGGRTGPSTRVCVDVDAQRYATLWLDTVSGGFR